jgi:hypothetical protein
MREALAAAALAALLASGCALRPAGADRFAFAVMGDVPYTDAEEPLFEAMLRELDGEDLAFLAHVGDFKGPQACSDALFEKRRAQFDASRHPFVFTPGDNEWADCPRHAERMEALGRLARLREIFFARDETLGRSRFAQRVQRACLAPPVEGCGCSAQPENRSWSRAGVAFVTVNVTGSRNNVGFGAATDAEARCRDVANGRWIAAAAEEALARGDVALVILAQANPWWTEGREFEPFLASVREAAERLRRPVLLVHGDTHFYRADQPFRDAMGEALPHLARLETYGSPFVGYVRVEVDPSTPGVFTFQPRLRAVTAPSWLVR